MPPANLIAVPPAPLIRPKLSIVPVPPVNNMPTLDAPVASIYRPWQLIFGRDDMPDDFAYLLAKAYDDNRDAFRQTHIPYSYDSREVARDNGIPLHTGAERYYREQGYLPVA